MISDKSRPLTPLPKEIDRLAAEISKSEPGRLVVVHGGGSFGHAVAREFNLTSGPQKNAEPEAFAVTHQAMVSLNTLVVDSLLVHGLKALALPPASFIVTEEGRWRSPTPDLVGGLLRLGLTPVLYGDVVLDSGRGFTILSGDQIAAKLAVDLGAERLLLVSDVEGVYPADPRSRPQSQPLLKMSLGDLKSLSHTPDEANPKIDVTGSMFGKLREMIPALERGVEVVVLDGRRPGNLLNALRGEGFTGTLLTRD